MARTQKITNEDRLRHYSQRELCVLDGREYRGVDQFDSSLRPLQNCSHRIILGWDLAKGESLSVETRFESGRFIHDSDPYGFAQSSAIDLIQPLSLMAGGNAASPAGFFNNELLFDRASDSQGSGAYNARGVRCDAEATPLSSLRSDCVAHNQSQSLRIFYNNKPFPFPEREHPLKSRYTFLALLILICTIAAFAACETIGCTDAQLQAADHGIGGTTLPAVIVKPATTTQPAVTTQPTNFDLWIHLTQDGATAAAPVVAAAAPVVSVIPGWGQAAGAGLAILSIALAFYGKYQNTQAVQSGNVIANAVPAILGSVTPEMIAAVPALTAFMSHPSAQNAIAALNAASAASKKTQSTAT
jgi:hypothetical protein